MDDKSMIFSKSGLTQSSPGLTQLALTGTQSQLPHTQRITREVPGLRCTLLTTGSASAWSCMALTVGALLVQYPGDRGPAVLEAQSPLGHAKGRSY